MPTVLSAALDALYANPEFGTAALYEPDGGDPVEVTIIWTTPDQSVPVGGITTRLASYDCRVRVSEIPEPERGATLTIPPDCGTIYSIGNRERDPLGLEWSLDLREP